MANNLYTIKQYTRYAWDTMTEDPEKYDYDTIENVLEIVWDKTIARLDIMATGKRIVPILRKIERTLRNAGLAHDDSDDHTPYVFDGWFNAWADSLTDPREKQYFIWSYDGKTDRENGHWSYSWGIEQLDENTWYIFLNLAL